ncbi:uncharacterized protein LOC134240676 isoform X2 [Saccostrea cucullata]|uniref:uncharacterized protein LOC134240676 isoform X2 n=1 Tax=Saccostrea cuccullata TaxID=36930 RepID=UPI002ED5942A
MAPSGYMSRCVFILIVSIAKVFAMITNITYEFGRDCNVRLENVNEDRPVYVTYNGEEISCSNHFSLRIGREADSELYAICVRPVYFIGGNCAIELSFEYAFIATKLQTLSCTKNNGTKFCASAGRDLHIFFVKLSGKDSSSSKFKFLLTVEKVKFYASKDEDKNALGTIIGGVFGSFFQLFLCLACYRYRLRKNSSEGQVLNRTPSNEVYQLSYPHPSHSNQLTANSESPHQVSSQSLDHLPNNISASPPSYDEVVNNKQSS